MPSPTLLESIADFYRRCGVAESTFGRRAVNDGKLVSRLSAYLRSQGGEAAPTAPPVRAAATAADSEPPGRNFRSFDNRQKYLLFVTICGEKGVVARHPATALVVTNMHYAESPWLAPRSLPAATSMVWNDSVERLAGEQGLGVYAVTQFCFAPERISLCRPNQLRRRRAHGTLGSRAGYRRIVARVERHPSETDPSPTPQ